MYSLMKHFPNFLSAFQARSSQSFDQAMKSSLFTPFTHEVRELKIKTNILAAIATFILSRSNSVALPEKTSTKSKFQF